MLKKFAVYFVYLILSFLMEQLGWTTQGKAFLYLILGTVAAVFIILTAYCLFKGVGALNKIVLPIFILLISLAIGVGISLLVTFVATKLFNVDFYFNIHLYI